MQYYITTFGCQMNKNDSERIAGLLLSLGWTEADDEMTADLLLANTCSVRQMAEDRVVGLIKKWTELKIKNPKIIIAITGCLPGRDHDGKLKKKFPGVDLFFPIDDLIKLPEWLGQLRSDLFDYLSLEPKYSETHRAFVSIQTGCNNFCAYCVVPYARGRERNRPVVDILVEVKKLAKNGCWEITLLGQVVNNYQAPDKENFNSQNPFLNKDDFSALLWELNQVSGIERIHFTAAHPRYFNDYQIEALKLPKQVNYLHLPVQSGDDEILKKMNRPYVSEDYLKIVEKLKKAKPDMALGTDLIVGYCGETDEQFKNTIKFYKKADFDISYNAIYSQRSGTLADKNYADDVSWETKKYRWHYLQKVMEEIVLNKNQKYVGQVVSVLVDSCKDGICSGNSREFKFTQFLGDESLVGKFVSVKIEIAYEWLLKGKICDQK
jgi:tRNA-2-methylthio-N6-dimethylallyladenosine synthase